MNKKNINNYINSLKHQIDALRNKSNNNNKLFILCKEYEYLTGKKAIIK